MKKIEMENETVIIGTGRELKPVYKAMKRAYYGMKSDLAPYFTDQPRMRETDVYGIEIADGFFTIINADIIVRLLFGEEV